MTEIFVLVRILYLLMEEDLFSSVNNRISHYQAKLSNSASLYVCNKYNVIIHQHVTISYFI